MKFKLKTEDSGYTFVETTTGLTISIKVHINMKWYIEIEGYQFKIENALFAQRIINYLKHKCKKI